MTAQLSYHELLIEHLRMEVDERDSEIIELRRDLGGYQQLARASLDRIAELTQQNDRLRACVARHVGLDVHEEDRKAAA